MRFTLVHGDGLRWLREHPRGLVVTDSPKRGVEPLLALCERYGLKFVNAYGWFQPGKFPGEKSIEPYRRIIEAFPEENLIVDPYMGSGPVGIAALECGRRFVGIEINRQRFEYARSRIEDAAARTDSEDV